MLERQLYEYAVIHIVPRVERGEFVNAGIILFCKKTGFLGCRIFVSEDKLKCLHEVVDLSLIYQNLKAFEKIATGDDESNSPIAKLDAPSRFRWLTATRSTILQCSKVHPGFTNNFEAALNKLMQHMVM